jgi:hypothetical protein
VTTVESLLAALLIAAAPAPQEAAPQPAPQGRRLLPEDCSLPAAAPHVAVGADGTVLVPFASDDTIWCTVSRDGGRSFPPPDRVGAAGQLESGIARGPRGAVAGESLAVLAVCGETLRGQDGNLLAWRSTDDGQHWQGPLRVNDVPDSAREGLHDVVAGPAGQLLAVWLDLRADGTELWGDVSLDGGATWGVDRLLYASPDGSICECCAPAAAMDPASGEAMALWRNKLGPHRDMFALRLPLQEQAAPGAASPLGTGHWEIAACPMAGGGLAFTSRGELLTFWRRGSTLYTAAPGLAESEVGEGREAAVAAGPEGFVLAWTDPDGVVMTGTAPSPGSVQGRHALGRGLNLRVAGAPDGHGPVVAVWETGEGRAEALRVQVLAERRAP